MTKRVYIGRGICECSVDQEEWGYQWNKCPLHAATEELLATLEDLSTAYADFLNDECYSVEEAGGPAALAALALIKKFKRA